MYVTLDLKSDFWEIVNFVTGKFVKKVRISIYKHERFAMFCSPL